MLLVFEYGPPQTLFITFYLDIANLFCDRYVRTLWHRLPSDSGHLAFNEGERLRVILEVDDQHLLCCRGEQKGLVPRDAVLLEDF